MAVGPSTFTVAEVRQYMGLPSAGEDNVLAMLAAAVERDVARYTARRSLLNAAYSKTFSVRDPGTTRLFLPDYPVAASPAPTLAIDGTALVYGTDFGVELARGEVFRLPATLWQEWPPGDRHVVVTWTGGLAVDAAAFAEACPDLKAAMIEQVAFVHKYAGNRGRLGVRRTQLDTGQVVNDFDSGKWAPGVEAVLQQYRARRVG